MGDGWSWIAMAGEWKYGNQSLECLADNWQSLSLQDSWSLGVRKREGATWEIRWSNTGESSGNWKVRINRLVAQWRLVQFVNGRPDEEGVWRVCRYSEADECWQVLVISNEEIVNRWESWLVTETPWQLFTFLYSIINFIFCYLNFLLIFIAYTFTKFIKNV